MLRAAIAEQRIAGLLEAFKQVLVGVPALTPLIVALPGAHLLGPRAGPCITIAPAMSLALKLAARVVVLGLATGAPTSANNATAGVNAAALPGLETTSRGA